MKRRILYGKKDEIRQALEGGSEVGVICFLRNVKPPEHYKHYYVLKVGRLRRNKGVVK